MKVNKENGFSYDKRSWVGLLYEVNLLCQTFDLFHILINLLKTFVYSWGSILYSDPVVGLTDGKIGRDREANHLNETTQVCGERWSESLPGSNGTELTTIHVV